MKEVSVFDAKTHFSGIIADVTEKHEQFTITKRGVKVAKIIPYDESETVDLKSVFKAMDQLSNEVAKKGVNQEDIRKMREEGRK